MIRIFNKLVNRKTLSVVVMEIFKKMEKSNPVIKKVCVFCGSRSPKSESYKHETEKFGAELLKNDIGLVYGGGNVGMMGIISEKIHNGIFLFIVMYQVGVR